MCTKNQNSTKSYLNKLMNKNPIKLIDTNLIKLPTPINISIWWNYESLLRIFLIIQFIRGIPLSLHYCPDNSIAFQRIIHITQNVNNGWLIHYIHK